jgi:outer membrane protein assembly factor BamB
MQRSNLILPALGLVVMITGSCAEPTTPGGGGPILWRVTSGAPELPLVPVANSDRSVVYFATPDNRLKKIRGNDGHVVWDVPAGIQMPIYPRMNAVLSAGVVALSKVDIYAFDTTTGSSRWTYIPADREETGDRPLVANDSTIFAGGLNGNVHAVNANTGVARWIRNLAAPNHSVAAISPTVSGDMVFVCSTDHTGVPYVGTFWALDVNTGEAMWSYQFAPLVQGGTSACYGSAATWHDLVIEPEGDGRVFAFDRATGSVRWIAPPVQSSGQPGQDERLAAVGGDIVLVTSVTGNGAIVAYDAATGVERWRRTDYSGSFFLPAVDSTIAYVDHGWVFASYDLATGAIRWATPRDFNGPATDYKGTPIIAGDRIYVAGLSASYALHR